MDYGSYRFDEKKRFIIEDFDKAKTFSSFLPGIAGVMGIPMWTFYVNRGQAISSFGVQDKNAPIMEFSPANIAYKNVSTSGFRTFIKFTNSGDIYEPFQPTPNKNIKRNMYIQPNQLSIEEVNQDLNLKVKVHYFNLPEANFAGLVRQVEISNLDEETIEVEVLDGLPEILPFGVENAGYKEVGNLLRSWMEVYNLDAKIPYYHVRASMGDEAEVSEINGGHFYLSFSEEGKLISPIVDADIIFGSNNSLLHPDNFGMESLEALMDKEQITANKVPCGFTPVARTLDSKQKMRICTVIGHTADISTINKQANKIASFNYIEKKQNVANKLVRDLTNNVQTKTSHNIFDEYCRQNYLDNFLRGGYPYILDNGQDGFVYHLYSRKHGDQERDYNFFTIAPEYYSQGNGNFRDMNQNRRNDIYFNPAIGSFNTKMFMSLIQADGYNPLLVKGCSFEIRAEEQSNLEKIIRTNVLSDHKELLQLLSGKFTPGKLINFISDKEVHLKVDKQEFLKEVLKLSEQNIEAAFGEGFWIDHWTYNLDLVESYLDVFPDKLEEFLFRDNSYKYFDSPVMVLPRSEKYVLSKGNVRQYGSVTEDEEKMSQLGVSLDETNWLKTDNGHGDIYHSNLFVKLVSSSLIKFATLDPFGIGIEMEANKPGWNDAMNGLPGLFGSGVSETFELKRMIQFILSTAKEFSQEEMTLPIEMNDLLNCVSGELDQYFDKELDDFTYWNHVATLRETYRQKIRFGIKGEEVTVPLTLVVQIYQKFLEKINLGIAKAEELGNGLYPTYLAYDVADYEVLKDEGGQEVLTAYGLPKVTVKEFSTPKVLPYFLEGPARAMKTVGEQEKAKKIYQTIKETELFDKQIHMYKTSVSLNEESFEIGRIKAFTPGWLERESVFLHMSYKYLLELIKAGLHEEFYNDIQTSLIPFLDPKVYGRSTLENSSFLASSVNPNPNFHGQGFVARLSGSTAEFLGMWKNMFIGKKVFLQEEGELRLQLTPILPNWLFDDHGEVSFTFLGKIDVTYRNLSKKHTFGDRKAEVKSYTLLFYDGNKRKIDQPFLNEKEALAIREGLVSAIEVELG
ncbi:cellobiose phosphorylase [Aquibacillus kalidii]|uniref:cellobiose phosphorylase n=1 Tax=Aquibacillus kalidii TaxID=2762597 RepID=UPI001647AF37|nr:cellobiose phosphorylase [Aquibacillus kalidii]